MSESDRFMAFAVLSEDAPARGDDIVAAINEQIPNGEARAEPVGEDAGMPAGAALVVEIGKTIVTVMYMDQPMLPGALDEAVAKDRMMPNAAEVVAGHKAHYTISHLEPNEQFADARQAAIAMTRVCAALCQLTPVLCVHWAAAQTIAPAANVREAASVLSEGEWPLFMWSNFLPYAGKDDASGQRRVGMLTQGLAPFVGREIEFAPAPMPPEQVFDRVINLSSYLMARGAVLGEGNTVGVSESERIRVHYGEVGQAGIKTFRLTVEVAEAV